MKTMNEVSKKEKHNVLTNYLGPELNRPIAVFPSKEKKKLIILEYITLKFKMNKLYSELQVNELISPIHHDYVSVRRYLVEYGFIGREKDGSGYWLLNKYD